MNSSPKRLALSDRALWYPERVRAGMACRMGNSTKSVIASEASNPGHARHLDCFVACAPRNARQ